MRQTILKIDHLQKFYSVFWQLIMMSNSKAVIYFEELIQVYQLNPSDFVKTYKGFRVLLMKVAKELTEEESIQFSNLFSRLSFVCKKFNLNRKIHSVRVVANQVIQSEYKVEELECQTHMMWLSEFIASAYNVDVPDVLKDQFPSSIFKKEMPSKKSTKIKLMRVEVVRIENDFLICDSEENEGGELIQVAINDSRYNLLFVVTEKWIGAQLNLLNVEVDENEIFYPKFLILEPDYLIDVSSIAECFQEFGKSEYHYLKSKFEEVPNNKYIRLGNFANQVVDELFANGGKTDVSFRETFEKDFKAYPFEYTVCKDLKDRDDFIEYMKAAQLQFTNIKRVISGELKQNEIEVKNAILEPSFLCDAFGIQGRLDILELKPEGKAKIVELKSGGVPFPDNGKSIKPNHRSQLYLYYQLIAVLNDLDFSDVAQATDGYILYSKVHTNNLRFDQPNLNRVQEIFDVRNRILLNEMLLTENDADVAKTTVNKVTSKELVNASGVNAKFKQMLERQIDGFLKPLEHLTAVESAYFYNYVNFIAKEQSIAKLGNGDYNSNNGLASLWLNSFDVKKDQFEILYDLVILQNRADQEVKEIVFERTNAENSFVSFRTGDMCVLYPRSSSKDNATSNQVLKCTIKSLTVQHVTLSFRFKQNNTLFFEEHEKWALERDSVDSSFTSMYRGLYAFIKSNQKRRDLLLNQRPPVKSKSVEFEQQHLSEEQNRVINKALTAKDYFLLNGPPGTGKTSIVIKELLKELHKDQELNVLLLAYTNRAVDELCDAVNTSFKESDGLAQNNFIRIGNPMSCSEQYKPNLLSQIIHQEIDSLEKKGESFSRGTLSGIIEKHKVFVSTISSISGRTDVFKLKKFDLVIIDEASQVLEPQILSVLAQTKKFILIGDHKQLPAIVLQNKELSKVTDPLLLEMGLSSRKNSLFERLYTHCEKEGHSHAFDMLTYQGRMHEDVAAFPNQAFYNSALQQAHDIPNLPVHQKNLLKRQVSGLSLTSSGSPLGKAITSNRVLFFPSKTDLSNLHGKSNVEEADLVVQLIKEYQEIYELSSEPFDAEKTIGVITPFRNQIALIKQKMEEAEVMNFQNISVDTVERYQGSQRDIIILSFAIHNAFQLDSIINLNDDGEVDRKLNVALTRAKEQLVLIGNRDALVQNLVYKNLVDFVEGNGGVVDL